jgi:hypothetical protein
MGRRNVISEGNELGAGGCLADGGGACYYYVGECAAGHTDNPARESSLVTEDIFCTKVFEMEWVADFSGRNLSPHMRSRRVLI